jgi:tetratricopeptide (TPR) repeat protein
MSDESNGVTVSTEQKAELTLKPLFAGVPSVPDYFLGRDELLERVIGCLGEGHDVALWTGGLPGVGATALAATIAHHPRLHALFPDGVLWASCADEQDAPAILAAWANVLGVQLSNCSDDATKSLVLHNTIANRRILLVLDSPGFDEAVLLRCGGAHCAHLITTRDETLARDFANAESLLTVPPLAGDAALELLRVLAPQVTADEPQLTEEVARLTAGIPLVIHLLGAFLAAPEPCAVENLIVAPRFSATGPAIELSSARRRLMLAVQRLGNGEVSSATLQRAIALSVAALPSAALRAFRCLGAFAPAPHTFDSAAVQSICQCDAQTVNLLVARHLLEVSALDPAALVGHAALRQRTRAASSAESALEEPVRLTIRPLIASISQIRADAQAPERQRNYYLIQARECRDHGLNVDADYGQIRHACAVLPDTPAVLEFAWAMQHYHARRNLQHVQTAWVQRAQVQKTLSVGAPADPLPEGALPLANLLDQIGAAYRAHGQPQQAINYYRRALNLRELLPDASEQFALGHTLHQLGLAYHQLGQPQQALAILQSALPVLDGKDKRDPAGTALVLTDLGRLNNEMGQHEQAVDYLQRALAVYDDPSAAQALNTAGLVDTLGQLGQSCMQLGHYSQARAYLQRAMENRQRVMPGDVAGLAAVLGDLGECYTALGQHDQALTNLQRALLLHEQIASKTGLARAHSALGVLYQAMNRPDQALTSYQRALPLGEEIGAQAIVAQCCMGIGVVLNAKGRRDEALSYLQQAQSLLEPPASAPAAAQETVAAPASATVPPQQGAQLAAILNHTGSIYLDRNEPARAVEYLQRALQLRETATPADQSAVAQTLNNLGAAYSKLNQPEQALECLNRTLTIHAQLGDNAGESAARCNLAMLCLLQGQTDQAISNMKRAVELDREINSADLNSHQALLRRFEAERVAPPREQPAQSKESKPSFFGRLRKRA